MSYQFTEHFGEEDKVLRELINVEDFSTILKENSIDLLISKLLMQISKNIDFMKDFEKKVTTNIIVIFDNLKYRNENKNFINYKFIVKTFYSEKPFFNYFKLSNYRKSRKR